jgi:hypothetical protein
VLLAELNVRHTRRHMPTRRVAVGDLYLPMTGAGHGVTLLRAVVAEHVDGLDEDQHDALERLLIDARGGFSAPRIALRHRLQTDTHGLDLSSHRVVGGAPGEPPTLELDRHGAPAPQVIGAVLAAAALPPAVRGRALEAVRAGVRAPGVLPGGLRVRRLVHGLPAEELPAPGTVRVPPRDDWAGIPTERRWAMEVLGLGPTSTLDRTEVLRRFRRLVRLAHPDHGGGSTVAATRIAELGEAREVLLGSIASVLVQAGS